MLVIIFLFFIVIPIKMLATVTVLNYIFRVIIEDRFTHQGARILLSIFAIGCAVLFSPLLIFGSPFSLIINFQFIFDYIQHPSINMFLYIGIKNNPFTIFFIY